MANLIKILSYENLKVGEFAYGYMPNELGMRGEGVVVQVRSCNLISSSKEDDVFECVVESDELGIAWAVPMQKVIKFDGELYGFTCRAALPGTYVVFCGGCFLVEATIRPEVGQRLKYLLGKADIPVVTKWADASGNLMPDAVSQGGIEFLEKGGQQEDVEYMLVYSDFLTHQQNLDSTCAFINFHLLGSVADFLDFHSISLKRLRIYKDLKKIYKKSLV